jgi:hypothetical protein
MSLEVSLEIRGFLEQFFGKGNRLTLEYAQKNTFLRPWIARLEKGLPTVLPCARETETDWYGIALSEQQFRGLREELTAFVGPTYSTFRGQRVILDSNDPVEAAVQELTQGNAFKFQGSRDNAGNSTELRNALSRMLKVLERKTIGSYEVPRATGRVLRDFYTGLRVGDRSSAEKELQYLRNQNRLDTLNLLFLRVQMLAELQAWNELLHLPELADLLQVRRPFAVTQAIIQAVYQCELSRFEATNAARSAVTYFQEAISPQYGILYTNRAGSRVAEVVKSFMLLAVGGETPNPTLRDELLTVPGLAEADQLYLQNLARLLPTTVPVTNPVAIAPLEEAVQAAESGNYDRVITLLKEYPPSPQTVRLLLEAAYELQTLESERVALQAFDQLSGEEQSAIQAMRRNRTLIESLIGKAATPTETTADLVPTNWLEWLSILDHNPDWERASHSARQGAQEWVVTDLLDEPGAIAQFLSLQNTIAAKANETLQNAFPHLLSSFQKDPDFPRREFLPLYTAILDTLVFGIIPTGAGDSHLTLFNELVAILLALGVHAQQYTDLIDYALELWKHYQAPSTIDWGLDLINVFVVYPCFDRERRVQLLFKVANLLQSFAGRLDEAQINIFCSLAKDLKLEASFSQLFSEKNVSDNGAVEGKQDIFRKLRNKAILIYTLTEPVAQRVKSFLESICEGITIHLSHDKGGNDRLRQWVRNDDLVVMVTASAKHAATGFIEEHRPQGRPLLRVNSKGSAGILREIQLHLTILHQSDEG